MPTFAIADLHLSTLDSTNKSMEVFGKRWSGYTEKLKSNWKRLITDNDTVIIPGDISWALTLEEAKSDLEFINSLPGKKIFGKGNHDFWWTTMKKHAAFFADAKSIRYPFFSTTHTKPRILLSRERAVGITTRTRKTHRIIPISKS